MTDRPISDWPAASSPARSQMKAAGAARSLGVCRRYTVYAVLYTSYCIRRTVYAVLYTPYCIRRTVYAVLYTPYCIHSPRLSHMCELCRVSVSHGVALTGDDGQGG